MSDVKKLLSQLEKEFSVENVVLLDEVPELDVISSGIPSLDFAMGIGGYPRRLVTEVFGPESVGKSVLSMKAIASAQEMGLIPVLITTEGLPDKEWAKIHGVDADNLVVLFAHTAEQMVEQAKTVSANPDVGLMVIDSLAAVGTAKEISEGGAKQAFGISGQIAHMMHTLLPNCWTTNKACLLMNQVRDKANQRNLPIVTSPGGHSLHHAASIRIQLKPGDKVVAVSEGEKREIGKEVKAVVKKNKADSPDKTASWWIYHAVPDDPPRGFPGKGVDISGSLFDVAKRLGVIQGTTKLSIPEVHFEQSKDTTGLGRANMINWMLEDPANMKSVQILVKEKLSGVSGEATKVNDSSGDSSGG